jgi:anti-sigma B factor antagonist
VAFTEPEFKLTDEPIDESTHLVAVSGELHVSTAPAFARGLEDAIARGATDVVLDLDAVEFIDSTGLTVLLNGLRSVTRRQGHMALVVSNPTVLRLFEVTGLDATFDIRRTREEALSSVRAAG